VDVSVPNFGIQELTEYGGPDGEAWSVFEGGAQFVEGEGALDVPDEPGLGIDVDWEAAKERAADVTLEPIQNVRHDDGSVAGY